MDACQFVVSVGANISVEGIWVEREFVVIATDTDGQANMNGRRANAETLAMLRQ